MKKKQRKRTKYAVNEWRTLETHSGAPEEAPLTLKEVIHRLRRLERHNGFDQYGLDK